MLSSPPQLCSLLSLALAGVGGRALPPPGPFWVPTVVREA